MAVNHLYSPVFTEPQSRGGLQLQLFLVKILVSQDCQGILVGELPSDFPRASCVVGALKDVRPPRRRRNPEPLPVSAATPSRFEDWNHHTSARDILKAPSNHTSSSTTTAVMSQPSLAQYIKGRPSLSKWMTPIANWYANAAGYRKLGLRYDYSELRLVDCNHNKSDTNAHNLKQYREGDQD